MVGLIENLSLAQQIGLIYIGYFNRSADGQGFQFWFNENANAQNNGQSREDALKNVANAFSAQKETYAAYPFLASKGSFHPTDPIAVENVRGIVRDAYQNLFDRGPDANGLAYWTNQIATGSVQIGQAILAIANGAVGADAEAIKNKTTAGVNFTTKTSTAGIGMDAPPSEAFINAARAAVQSVSADVDSMRASDVVIANFVASASGSGKSGATATTANPAPVGSAVDKFALTAGADALVGTSGSDVFTGDNASQAGKGTVQAKDSIDGGGGEDLFKYAGANGVAPALANVEVVRLTGAASDLIDFSAAVGLREVRIASPLGGVVTTLPADVRLTIEGDGKKINFVTAEFGAADKVDIALLDVAMGGLVVLGGPKTVAAHSNAGSGAAGGGNVLADMIAAAGGAPAQVVFDGARNLKIASLEGFSSVVNKLDASAVLDVKIDAKKDVSYVGGQGVDIVRADAAGVTGADRIDGGGGIDTLELLPQGGAWRDGASLAGVKNFEVLRFLGGKTAPNGDSPSLVFSDAFNAANEIGRLELKAGYYGGSLKNIDASAKDGIVLLEGNRSMDFSVAGFAKGGWDAATLVFDGAASQGLVNFYGISFDDVDQLTIVSTAASDALASNGTLYFDGSDLDKIILTGSGRIALGSVKFGAEGQGPKTMDARASVGFEIGSIGNAANGVVILQSAGADSMNLSAPNAKDSIVYQSAADSKAGAFDAIAHFEIRKGVDNIDLRALKLGTVSVVDQGSSFAKIDAATGIVNADVAAGWFGGGNVAFAANGAGDAFVYADADKNGAFNADRDLVIKLTGLGSDPIAISDVYTAVVTA